MPDIEKHLARELLSEYVQALQLADARIRILENAAKAVLAWWDDPKTDAESINLMNAAVEVLRSAVYPEK